MKRLRIAAADWLYWAGIIFLALGAWRIHDGLGLVVLGIGMLVAAWSYSLDSESPKRDE